MVRGSRFEYPHPFQYVRPDRAASVAIARPFDQDGHDDDGIDVLPEFPPNGRAHDDVEARVYAAAAAFVVVVVVDDPGTGAVEDGGGRHSPFRGAGITPERSAPSDAGGRPLFRRPELLPARRLVLVLVLVLVLDDDDADLSFAVLLGAPASARECGGR